MKKKSKPSTNVVTVTIPNVGRIHLDKPIALSYWSLKRGQDLGYARSDK